MYTQSYTHTCIQTHMHTYVYFSIIISITMRTLAHTQLWHFFFNNTHTHTSKYKHPETLAHTRSRLICTYMSYIRVDTLAKQSFNQTIILQRESVSVGIKRMMFTNVQLSDASLVPICTRTCECHCCDYDT